MFAEQIYVFSSDGDLIALPAGATVLDMAYALGEDVGDHCIGGKIGHRLVKPAYVLESGDPVEILTVRAMAPEEKWLGWCVTAHARNIIKSRI
ncbi:MAG: TGS domain-containing protein [Duncaniella sp.]|nr:TGS domain-containing protein [Duncaniella sp.]